MNKRDKSVDGNQSGKKSARDNRPNCYDCVYRGCAEFSAHSTCNHPIFDAVPAGQFMPMLWMQKGLKSPFEKILNLAYSKHGFNSGWFMWPINFDPIWLETCDGFKQK